MSNAVWNQVTQEKFKLMLSKMPLFHRRMAEGAAARRSEKNAEVRSAPCVEDADVIAAFFQEVPKPFYSLMIKLLEDVGFDYKKYGFPKNNG